MDDGPPVARFPLPLVYMGWVGMRARALLQSFAWATIWNGMAMADPLLFAFVEELNG